MNSIRNNLPAQRAANTLSGHYSRLSTSVERLSTGLRINSAADDASGLAIRELMRADAAALHQGARNANDAISLLQTADGALAIIDEKLIRMKELAEQAATGTYDSIQRLMIASEYQAMADEIDRIARATDFNGVKLLDGSLSGQHNGSGLTSTGKMKIHFGPGNDSAEDYYYVEIGDCTAGALGLGVNSQYKTGGIEYIRVETVGQVQQTYTQPTACPEYTDPVTGNVYYKDGDKFYSDITNPAGSYLDETADRVIIERLGLQQDVQTTRIQYEVYIDPVTSTEYYYHRTYGYVINPYDPDNALNSWRPAEREIINRLQNANRGVQIVQNWKVYADPAGNKFYSSNDGDTFVPDYLRPDAGVLDSKNAADKAVIDSFEPVMTTRVIQLPVEWVTFYAYTDKATSTRYWSSDGGLTFYLRTSDESSRLTDKNIINRLEVEPRLGTMTSSYYIFTDPASGKDYYTDNFGKTFIADVARPNDVAFDSSNAADVAAIAALVPKFRHESSYIRCDIWEDPTDNNERYYTQDNGQTFFHDLDDPDGSRLDAANPDHAAVIANLQQTAGFANLVITWDTYIDTQTKRYYYSCDGGQTFVSSVNNPGTSALDPAVSQNIIDRLFPYCETRSMRYNNVPFLRDPVLGTNYYASPDGNPDVYYDTLGKVALVRSDPAQAVIMDRLESVQQMTTTNFTRSFPDKYYVYEDIRNGNTYYSWDGGKTFTSSTTDPYGKRLDPDNSLNHQWIVDNLQPKTTTGIIVEYVPQVSDNINPADGYTISTQESAQKSLAAIDRAIVSKDKIRAHLGALQNRLENTVANLNIQAENLLTAESRISDADVALEMTEFVRNQVLTQSATAMLGQANSYPHMLAQLLNG